MRWHLQLYLAAALAVAVASSDAGLQRLGNKDDFSHRAIMRREMRARQNEPTSSSPTTTQDTTNDVDSGTVNMPSGGNQNTGSEGSSGKTDNGNKKKTADASASNTNTENGSGTTDNKKNSNAGGSGLGTNAASGTNDNKNSNAGGSGTGTNAASGTNDNKNSNAGGSGTGTNAASGTSDNKNSNAGGSGTGTNAASGSNANGGQSAEKGASDAGATTGSSDNKNTTAAVNDPNAPIIDFLLSNYWNSTYFLAQSNPKIKFVKNGNFSDSTQNSSATTPLIVGVEVLEHRQYQIMEGLGAGLTDASAIVLQALKSTHPDAYAEILNLCFNESPEWLDKGGAGMNMIRTPIGASDFGFVEYSYDDTVDGSADLNFTQFNIGKSIKRWETIRDIQKINPRLRVMATPWSQPAWMKNSTGSFHGGSVLEQYEDAFAAYMTKFVTELQSKENIKVDTLSLQNEPMYDKANYPCTLMPAYQEARIGPLVRKRLDAANLKNVGILAYDHNWDNDTYAVSVFDDASQAFKGVAWHCYAGEARQQDKFNSVYPGKTVWFTECTKISQFFNEPWNNIKDQFSKLITTNSSIDHDSSAVILWNLALQIDPDGFTTPTLPNVCKNCLAPILIYNNVTAGNLTGADMNKINAFKQASNEQGVVGGASSSTNTRRDVAPSKNTGTPTSNNAGNSVNNGASMQNMEFQQNSGIMASGQGGMNSSNINGKLNAGSSNENAVIPPVRNTYYRSSDFVVLAHLGRAIRPQQGGRWAQRVGVRTSEDGEQPRLLAQVFRNSLGNGSSRWSLVLLQWNDHYGYNFAKFEDMTINIKFRDYVANITLPPGAFTMQWTAVDSAFETNPATRTKTTSDPRTS